LQINIRLGAGAVLMTAFLTAGSWYAYNRGWVLQGPKLQAAAAATGQGTLNRALGTALMQQGNLPRNRDVGLREGRTEVAKFVREWMIGKNYGDRRVVVLFPGEHWYMANLSRRIEH
jgi:hypothetical protein